MPESNRDTPDRVGSRHKPTQTFEAHGDAHDHADTHAIFDTNHHAHSVVRSVVRSVRYII